MLVERYLFNHYPPGKRHVSALFESMIFRFIKAKMPFRCLGLEIYGDPFHTVGSEIRLTITSTRTVVVRLLIL